MNEVKFEMPCTICGLTGNCSHPKPKQWSHSYSKEILCDVTRDVDEAIEDLMLFDNGQGTIRITVDYIP
jgi:hypothetical protein